MIFLKALGFLSWMYLYSEDCNVVTLPTVLMEHLEYCKGGLGYFATFKNYVGVAACSDHEIYVCLENSTCLKADSVHKMDVILHE